MLDLAALNFEKGGGLVTVVAQDALTGAVLMVAHADREALERTVATGEMHFRSRTRGLWRKGETSGNTLAVVSLSVDCDGDAVLARVRPAGPACHTGEASCFGEGALAADALGVLAQTIEFRAREALAGTTTVEERDVDTAQAEPTALRDFRDSSGRSSTLQPGGHPSYTRRLLDDRNLRLKKLGEETAELIAALASSDSARAAEEGADLLYHLLVALRAAGVSLDDVRRILDRRRRSRRSKAPDAAPE